MTIYPIDLNTSANLIGCSPFLFSNHITWGTLRFLPSFQEQKASWVDRSFSAPGSGRYQAKCAHPRVFINTPAYAGKGLNLILSFKLVTRFNLRLLNFMFSFTSYSLLVRQVSSENGRNSESVNRRPGFKRWLIAQPLFGCDLGKSLSFGVKGRWFS